ncbi:nitrate reductase molybdenum cofactor assembly chaperone [Actinomadura barringtoniae]|uniref:Nitrate reductase molybdenum cofactor assembly chaperone n=1 Tax=Actinomadura barringtoniae TaxID=1427535 RepID=A0A939P8Q2_9ACTN|nr:nitrate reductase molybdenum cofactor assembly chaperone [Actinomadura barringtoniae]MBO2447452.1 nitrate reductase molybdenum cofactor assembly chaperone [Actinomadura barringtoniae]
MDERLVWQAASLLLSYPDEELYERRPMIRSALGQGPAAERLAAFLGHMDATPLGELAEHYVETFDRRRRCCLYMTYYRDGDTRRRGGSLAALKGRYREAGLELDSRELPDFLPIVLEFAALHDGADLLTEYRPGLELLRLALLDRRSPYAAPVEAVCASLPGPSPRDRAEAMKLARSGPPGENVGLEPFGLGLEVVTR